MDPFARANQKRQQEAEKAEREAAKNAAAAEVQQRYAATSSPNQIELISPNSQFNGVLHSLTALVPHLDSLVDCCSRGVARPFGEFAITNNLPLLAGSQPASPDFSNLIGPRVLFELAADFHTRRSAP